MKTLNPADFPKFPEVAVDKKVVLSSGTLTSMVRQVSRAVSRDETRATLTGILFVIEGPTVRMVATDSYRLAVREIVLETVAGEDVEVVIPGKALEEVSKLLGDTEEVSIGVSENQIVFEFGETTFVTRRIEGTFPNYKQLIPKETETNAVVSAEEFTAAVKRVSLMALHNTPLKINISVADQTLSLSATTQDVGDASEDLMVKAEGRGRRDRFQSRLPDGRFELGADRDTPPGGPKRAQARGLEDRWRRRIPLPVDAGSGRLGTACPFV